MLTATLMNYYKSIREHNARKRKGLQVREEVPQALKKAGAPANSSTDSDLSGHDKWQNMKTPNSDWNQYRNSQKSLSKGKDIRVNDSSNDNANSDEDKENNMANYHGSSGNTNYHFRNRFYHFNRPNHRLRF